MKHQIYIKAGEIISGFDDFKKDIQKRKDGKYTLDILTEEQIRSLELNAYYWGVLIEHLRNTIFKGYTREEIHYSLAKAYLPVKEIKLIDGTIEIVRTSTANLPQKQFIKYLQEIKQDFATKGIYIPEPNEEI